MNYNIEVDKIYRGVIKDKEGNIITTMYGKDKEMIMTLLEWEINQVEGDNQQWI